MPNIGGNFSIHGSVIIEIEVVESTDVVVLHMADIITINDTIKESFRWTMYCFQVVVDQTIIYPTFIRNYYINSFLQLNLRTQSGKAVSFISHEYDPSLEYYIGRLSESLVKDEKYIFSVEFIGYLNDQLRGFYRSVYTNELGEDV